MHRSRIARDVGVFALQTLRDQIGAAVYPTHRLDRKTSGVLLFAKSREAHARMQTLFRERKVSKNYLALVRGYLDIEGLIDYPLKNEDKVQDAQTRYQCLEQYEIPIPSAGFPTSRYALVALQPLTGRFHQLRKHMAHLRHPIIGDRPHGCNKQNKLWKEQFGMTHMLLHARELAFDWEDAPVRIEAPLSATFAAVLGRLSGYRTSA